MQQLQTIDDNIISCIIQDGLIHDVDTDGTKRLYIPILHNIEDLPLS